MENKIWKKSSTHRSDPKIRVFLFFFFFEEMSNAFRYLFCSHTEEAETELLVAHLWVFTPPGLYENTSKQRSKFSFSLPWLITPGKVWPPAVSTDPTIDASLAQPYNHLRTKLFSFAQRELLLAATALVHSSSPAPGFPPDPGSLCFWRAECWRIRQKV